MHHGYEMACIFPMHLMYYRYINLFSVIYTDNAMNLCVMALAFMQGNYVFDNLFREFMYHGYIN